MSEIGQKATRPAWANIGGASTALLAVGIFCVGFGPFMHHNVSAIGNLAVILAGMGLALAATIYLFTRR